MFDCVDDGYVIALVDDGDPPSAAADPSVSQSKAPSEIVKVAHRSWDSIPFRRMHKARDVTIALPASIGPSELGCRLFTSEMPAADPAQAAARALALPGSDTKEEMRGADAAKEEDDAQGSGPDAAPPAEASSPLLGYVLSPLMCELPAQPPKKPAATETGTLARASGSSDPAAAGGGATSSRPSTAARPKDSSVMTSTGVTRSALTRPACFGVLGMRVPPPTVRVHAPAAARRARRRAIARPRQRPRNSRQRC